MRYWARFRKQPPRPSQVDRPQMEKRADDYVDVGVDVGSGRLPAATAGEATVRRGCCNWAARGIALASEEISLADLHFLIRRLASAKQSAQLGTSHRVIEVQDAYMSLDSFKREFRCVRGERAVSDKHKPGRSSSETFGGARSAAPRALWRTLSRSMEYSDCNIGQLRQLAAALAVTASLVETRRRVRLPSTCSSRLQNDPR